MKIFIMGAGNLGSAFAKVLSAKNDIILFDINTQIVDDINKFHQNKRYLPKVRLSKKIVATTDISLIKDSEMIIIAVPSQVMVSAVKNIRQYYSGQLIVSASKGLSKEGLVLTDIIEHELKCKKSDVIALSGPCIAKELARDKPTLVMLGGNNHSTKKAKRCLETKHFFIRTTTDKQGIQLLGFYKNIIAILVGICDGLKLGNNFESSLVAKAYGEFYYLNINKNVHRHTFIGAAGLGDLYVTAMSRHSRNRTFGYLVGKGMHIDDVKKKIGQTIEGYENLLLLSTLKDKAHIDHNLTKILLEIIHESKSRQEVKEMLMKYLYAPDIKNIIFDWGNVLTKGVYTASVAKNLSKKYSFDTKEAKKLFKTLEICEKKALAGVEGFEKFFKRIKKFYPMMRYQTFLQAYKDSITYDDKLIAYCKKLKNDYSLYLLSNNYSIVSPILKKSKLSKIFDGMIFSNEIHLIKPHKDIFEYILHKYNIRAENCLFIDDSGRNVHAAQQNKINVIKYTDIEHLKKDIKNVLI